MAGEAEIERMVVRVLGDASQYEKSLKMAGKSTKAFVQRVSAQLQKVGAQMRSLGRSLSFRLTAPLIALGVTSTIAFGSFDKAMTESLSIMNVTERQAAKMKDTVLDMVEKGSLQGPKELADAYFFLASAGKNAEQSMSLLKPVSDFATAGTFDLSLATDLLTDSQSALGLSSKDVVQDTKNLVRISDELVKANTLANASVRQFAESLTADAATASKIINAELETTIAILALYADKGKKAAESGNLFGRAIRLLTKSARDNAKVFAEMNIRAIDEATGEYRNFIDILDDMNKAFTGLTGPQIGKALSDLGFEALAQKSILPLLNATDQLKFYEAELLKAGGITKDVADKQMKAFSNQMTVLKNKIKLVGIEIGEILSPTILKLSEKIQEGVTWWRELTSSTKRYIVKVAVVLALLGPLLITMGSLIGVTGFLTAATWQGILALRTMGIAFLAMGIKAQIGWAMATLGISLIIPALIGVVWGIIQLQKKTEVFNPLIEAAKELWGVLKDELGPAFVEMGEAIKRELGPVAKDFVKDLIVLARVTMPLIILQMRILAAILSTVAKHLDKIIFASGSLKTALQLLDATGRLQLILSAVASTSPSPSSSTSPKMMGQSVMMGQSAMMGQDVMMGQGTPQDAENADNLAQIKTILEAIRDGRPNGSRLTALNL